MTSSSSLLCRFSFFPRYHHINIIISELKTCNNDKPATALHVLYCNSPTGINWSNNNQNKKNY